MRHETMNFNGLRVDPDKFYEAIRDGMRDAIWQVANNATAMPCSDFYEMIKQGVREGIESAAQSGCFVGG